MTEEQRLAKNARQREYRATNRDKILEKAKIYYEKNKEEINTKAAGKRPLTKDRDLAYAAKYREENRAELNAKQKVRYAEDKPARLAYNRKYRYGITDEDYKRLIDQQQGKCAICGATGEKLCVDHDHKTKQIRGLLCQSCNLMIGQAGDSATRLRNAADYLDNQ